MRRSPLRLADLARAIGVHRDTLRTMLEKAGIEVYTSAKGGISVVFLEDLEALRDKLDFGVPPSQRKRVNSKL